MRTEKNNQRTELKNQPMHFWSSAWTPQCPWTKVALEERTSGTGLSLESVTDLWDRQRNSYAQTTFSKKVEDEMFKNGGTAEAKWCSLLCGWYQAVDESGVLSKSEVKSIRNVNACICCNITTLHHQETMWRVCGLPNSRVSWLLLLKFGTVTELPLDFHYT